MARIGARAGKNPTKNIEVNLTGSKYKSGGQKVRKKKGGVIRKPSAKIRESKKGDM